MKAWMLVILVASFGGCATTASFQADKSIYDNDWRMGVVVQSTHIQ